MKRLLLCLLLVSGAAFADDDKKTIRICDASGCSDRPRNTATFEAELAAQANPAQDAKVAALEALAAKDPRAAYDLGLRYFRGDGVKKDGYLAIKWMRDAGERGNFKAAQALGRFYLFGLEEMGPDPGEAERWLMMAADKGDKEAKKLLTQARKAKTEAQGSYERREADRKNGWVSGWYSGYAYQSYWRDGHWVFY
ncbi:MAG: sel1 repeat family protein [Hydrogenophaga sp.]|uniref:tetratricopeptide repeat protein n=1 Tax=Hydrogenophaga sp. TaxID=1904254 RepID=UPI001A43D013|nr:sel1 repeat family protein [Hydrogenophaga sp.]